MIIQQARLIILSIPTWRPWATEAAKLKHWHGTEAIKSRMIEKINFITESSVHPGCFDALTLALPTERHEWQHSFCARIVLCRVVSGEQVPVDHKAKQPADFSAFKINFGIWKWNQTDSTGYSQTKKKLHLALLTEMHWGKSRNLNQRFSELLCNYFYVCEIM